MTDRWEAVVRRVSPSVWTLCNCLNSAFWCVVYLVLGFWTLRSFTDEIAGVVLGWVWLVFGLVCGVAAFRSYTGKLAPALRWSIAAAIINVMVMVYAIFYDQARTPDQSTIAFLALVALLLGQIVLLLWLGGRFAKHGPTKVEVRSIIAGIPILALFGAWNSYVFEPHTARPIVEVVAQLSDPQTVYDQQGDPQQVVIRGTVTLHNAGRLDAGITSSLYKVTAEGLEAGRGSALDADTADRQLKRILNRSRILEVDGSNLNRLDRIVPTSDKRISLLALDQVLPSYSFLAPDETWTSTFAVRIPVRRLASVARLTLRAEMYAVSTVPTDGVRNCDADADAPVALHFLPFGKASPDYYACVEIPLESRTVIASLFGDDPALQYHYYIGHPEIHDSPSLAIRQGVSFGDNATTQPPTDEGYADMVDLADKYAPGASNATATELDVVRPSRTEP